MKTDDVLVQYCTLQITQQDSILSTLQDELRQEQQRHKDSTRVLQDSKQSIGELQDEIDEHQRRERDVSGRMIERETTIGRLQMENEVMAERARGAKETIADQEAQLKGAKSSLDAAIKRDQLHVDQVE